MNTGKIIKSKAAGNFTVIPNAIFDDTRLSLKSIGLLCYLLKLPPDWILHKSRLHTNLKGGRDLIMAAFTELENLGYITREEIKEKGKFMGFNYTVSEKPIISEIPQKRSKKRAQISEKPDTENPNTEKPFPENPKPEKPDTENPDLINKILTKDCINKSSLPFTNVKDKGASSFYQNFISIYDLWFKDYNEGTPPKIDGAQGNAAKSLIGHFKSIVKARAEKDNPDSVITSSDIESKTLEAWKLVLDNWHQLEPFYQDKTRLIDINSNIQIIIQKIKDATNGKKRATSGKINENGVKSMFDAINAKYGQTGGGV